MDTETQLLYNEAFKLHEWGLINEALPLFKQIRDEHPLAPYNHSDYLFRLHFADTPPQALYDAHKYYRELFEPWGKLSMPPHQRKPNGKIRIGYLSPDLHNHVSHWILEPLIHFHDKSRFELYFYCTNTKTDEYTARISKYADAWREHAPEDTEGILATIQKDEIDILVDLAGHTSKPSLPVFARRAAPIQIGWFGYMSTTGLLNMDYRITDEWRAPTNTLQQYSEKLLRLPNSYTFLPTHQTPAPSTLPMQKNGYVTFGSINAPSKITPAVLATWATLLRRIPKARLSMIVWENADYAEYLRAQFTKNGVDPARIRFLPRIPLGGYLKYLHEIDIALDPFPYTGGITTYHALSMGVPTITLEGSTEYGRNCAAVLKEAELTSYIAHSIPNYIDLAEERSQDIAGLAQIRSSLPGTLHQRMHLLTPRVEALFTELYRTSHG